MRHTRFIIPLVCGLLVTVHSAQSQPTRPKVGVVLSGGGAKGMAHIGALKVIEEAGIPIDCIVGTSMGSIIGGLYAIGYTPAQLDSMVRDQDWMFLLTDRVNSDEQNIETKENKQTFLISVPFGKDTKKNIFGGLIRGENLASLFSELTIGYHDSIDFNKLPVPFACVSEDLVSGKPFIFRSGVLAQAMRSSMAIPAVFTPVRKDSMVLIDGGTVDNYPVDVAKEMGADYIIGIDVQNDKRNADELSNAKDILFQLINLMGDNLYKENLRNTDTYIKVDVRGYSSSSFSSNAIDTLIRRGEAAARAQRASLKQLKSKLGLPETYTLDTRVSYPTERNKTVKVNRIQINGLDKNDENWLKKHFQLQENSEINIDKIKRIADKIRANLNYQSATYQLTRSENEGYDLCFELTKQTDNKLNIGIRFDSEEIASLLINATTHIRQRSPNTLSATIRLGKRSGADIQYAWAPTPLRKLSLGYAFRYADIDFLYKNRKIFNSTFRYHRTEFSYHDVWHTHLGFSLGISYELYDYEKFLYQRDFNLQPPYDVHTEHFFTYFAQAKYKTLDKTYFPAKGISVQASYELITDNFTKYKDKTAPSALKGSFESVFRISNRFSVLPSAYARFLFGNEIAYSKMNVMGGDTPSYLLERELPFVGIRTAQLMNHSLLIGGLKFRQRMGRIHYLTLSGNYAFNSNKVKNLFNSYTAFGCGVGYGIDSIFGPLELTANYMNHSSKASLFLNLGYRF